LSAENTNILHKATSKSLAKQGQEEEFRWKNYVIGEKHCSLFSKIIKKTGLRKKRTPSKTVREMGCQ